MPLPIPLPAALPAGTYRVVLGLYAPGADKRIPLTAGTPAPVELAGEHALLLTTVEVASE